MSAPEKSAFASHSEGKTAGIRSKTTGIRRKTAGNPRVSGRFFLLNIGRGSIFLSAIIILKVEILFLKAQVLFSRKNADILALPKHRVQNIPNSEVYSMHHIEVTLK